MPSHDDPIITWKHEEQPTYCDAFADDPAWYAFCMGSYMALGDGSQYPAYLRPKFEGERQTPPFWFELERWLELWREMLRWMIPFGDVPAIIAYGEWLSSLRHVMAGGLNFGGSSGGRRRQGGQQGTFSGNPLCPPGQYWTPTGCVEESTGLPPGSTAEGMGAAGDVGSPEFLGNLGSLQVGFVSPDMGEGLMQAVGFGTTGF